MKNMYLSTRECKQVISARRTVWFKFLKPASVTRCWNKKLPKILQALPKFSRSSFTLKLTRFKIFRLLWLWNLLSRPLKSPIWSRWLYFSKLWWKHLLRIIIFAQLTASNTMGHGVLSGHRQLLLNIYLWQKEKESRNGPFYNSVRPPWQFWAPR